MIIKAAIVGLFLIFNSHAWAKGVTITSFTPQNISETTNQIRAVFSDKMVDLSVTPPADIFSISCQPQMEGVAHWEDEKSWTFDFRTKLYGNKIPGGSRCSVTLKDDFKKAHGVTGKSAFSFQVDGPNMISLHPGDTSGRSKAQVAEDQIFTIGLDAEVDEASVVKNLRFKVDGVASSVQAKILSEAEKRAIMEASDFPRWQFDSGMPVIMVQARERFPANKQVSLIWGAGIKSAQGGLARQRELIVPFESRALLSANFSCERENAKADCSPFSDMELTFSAPVPASEAAQAELVSLDGKKRIKAVVSANEKGDSTLTRVTFPATLQERQSFKLNLPKGIRDDSGRRLANEASFPFVVKTSDFPPLAKFAADFGLIEANQKPVLLPATLRNLEAQVIGQKYAETSVNGEALRLGVASFPEVVAWMKKLDKKGSAASEFKDRDQSIFASGTKSTAFKVPLDEKGKAFEVVGIPLGGPGFYVVELQSRMLGRALLGKNVSMYVPTGALVTNLVVHSKWGIENSLFWVTALDNGQPVPQAKVVVHDCTGQAVWSAQTDNQGRAVFEGDIKNKLNLKACSTQQVDQQNPSRYDNGFFISAQSGDDFTFTHSAWSEGIEAWRFDSIAEMNRPEWATSSALATSVLDRTLVRAGEAKPIGMKHFIRVPANRGFKALEPARLPTEVHYEHIDTGTRYTQKLQWDANGTAVTEWAVPKDAKLGLYQITLSHGEESYPTSTFQVMEFKVPVMRGVIAFPPSQQKLVQPGKLDAQVSVTYQDGGPAVNQPVTFRYSLDRQDWVTFEDFGSGYIFGRQAVLEKETRSDSIEDRNLKTVEIPLRLNGQGSQVVTIPNLSGFDSPQTLMTQLEFADKNSETQNVTRSVTIYPSSRLVAVRAAEPYGSDRKIDFDAAVVDLKGKPVAGANPKFELFERVIYTHRTRMVGGFYSSESFTSIKRVKDQSAFNCLGATNKRGVVKCKVTAPDSGRYIIQASVNDANSHTSYGSDDIYVRGKRRAWFPADNNDRMDLIPEKKDLEAGETAKLQVQMPFAESNVLVTIEREGVIDSFVKHVTTNDPVIEVPIKPEYAPNVYVSAMAVRGRVSEPGLEETATVDLGKPSYKLGLAALNVNWKVNALKVEVKPSKDIYRPREHASVNVGVTLPDGKPAANAEFAIAVIDEGLLQLAKNKSWELLSSMMSRRPLSVETSTAQMQVVGKRHYGLKAKPSGGDGGQAPTRELFDTQLYWQARVKTDASGHATVSFPMNDSLTAFRVVAVAHSGLNRFGRGEAKIVSQQDVMVIPALGTVSRNGDKLAAEFTVRNTTKAAQTVTLSGHVKYTYRDGRVETKDLGKRQISLGAQDSEAASLGEVQIPDHVVHADYEVVVHDGNGALVDSIRTSQDVKPSVLSRTWMAQLSRLKAAPQVIGVQVPADALPDQGGVRVALKRTLADGVDTIKDYYQSYPFMSLEYLASRAVALNDKEEWAKVMQKLPSYLDAQGLVAYYPSIGGAQGSDTLTAYLLSISHDAQLLQGSAFDIPAELKQKMIDGLLTFVEGRTRAARKDQTQADTFIRRIRAIEVLARHGRAEPVLLTSLPNLASQQIPTATLIDMLSIYTRVNTPDRQAKLKAVTAAINSRLTRTGTGERLNDSGVQRPWYSMTSADYDQLQLILRITTSSNLRETWAQHLPLLMHDAVLMLKRGAWDITVANAAGALALKGYAKFVEPENVTGETKLNLDSVAQSFKWADAGHEKGGSLEFPLPKAGEHQIQAEHVGTGLPWAIVALNAAVPLASKVEHHFAVTKTLEPQKEAYEKGDVVTVTVDIKPQTDMPFVSVMDPIPAGAKILGSGLDNDPNQGPITRGFDWPDYQEITYDSYRASYSSISPAGLKLVYKVQLNNAGTFKLPATRVEAVYAPENFAEVPNADWTVKP